MLPNRCSFEKTEANTHRLFISLTMNKDLYEKKVSKKCRNLRDSSFFDKLYFKALWELSHYMYLDITQPSVSSLKRFREISAHSVKKVTNLNTGPIRESMDQYLELKNRLYWVKTEEHINRILELTYTFYIIRKELSKLFSYPKVNYGTCVKVYKFPKEEDPQTTHKKVLIFASSTIMK